MDKNLQTLAIIGLVTLTLTLAIFYGATQNDLPTPTGMVTGDGLFSPPSDNLNLQPSQLNVVEANPDDNTLTITSSDTITYNTGYYSLGGQDWQPYEFTGEATGPWIIGSATATIQIDANEIDDEQENYVLVYSCTRQNQGWNCHDEKWQINTFNTTKSTCGSNQCSTTTCDAQICERVCINEGETVPQQPESVCLDGEIIDTPRIPDEDFGDIRDGNEEENTTRGGSGLRGTYYDGMNFETKLIQRIDETVNMDLDRGESPASNLPHEKFSIRWEGKIQSDEAGTYNLRLTHDDGARVWINDELIIDEWQDQSASESSAEVNFEENQKKDIKIEYYENQIHAVAILRWTKPDGTKEVVPKRNLYAGQEIVSTPSVMITNPQNQASYDENEGFLVSFNVEDTTSITEAWLEKKNQQTGEVKTFTKNAPYQFDMNPSPGTYEFKAKAKNDKGVTGNSDPVYVSVAQDDEPQQPIEGNLLWSQESHWASWGASKPEDGDEVTIPSNITMELDESTPNLKQLDVNGELIIQNKELDITSDNIFVRGKLLAGSQTQPITEQVTITLTGDDEKRSENINHCGYKTLCSLGGEVKLHGAVNGPTWVKLSSTANPGDTSIEVDNNLDWQIGDEIVIVSTDYDPGQAERRTITNIQNGNVVSLNESLEYMHYGVKEEIEGFNVDMRATVMYMTRPIKIQGDEQSSETGFGGHMMFMSKHHHDWMPLIMQGEKEFIDLFTDEETYPVGENDNVIIEGVELERMGQMGLMARYPLHWHMYGEGEGNVMSSNSIHNSFQRCVSVHGTMNMEVRDNVAYDIVGHCYFLEDGIEEGNLFERNVGALIKQFSDGDLELIESDRKPSVFWISNPNNDFIDNIAAGAYMGHGFWYDVLDNPIGPSSTDKVEPRERPFGEFSGNIAHSNRLIDGHMSAAQNSHGLFVENIRNEHHSEYSNRVLSDFTAFKNDGAGFWAFRQNDVEDSVFVDNKMGVFMGNTEVRDSLFIGLSDNVGNPSSSEELELGRSLPQFDDGHERGIFGIENYDGWFNTRNNILMNYYELKDDIMIGAYGGFLGRNHAKLHVEGNTLINSELLSPSHKGYNSNRGPRIMIVHDQDGSSTDNDGERQYRFGPPVLVDTPNCEQYGEITDTYEQGKYICSDSSANVHVWLDDGDRQHVDEVTRDGVTYDSDLRILPTGYRYDLSMDADWDEMILQAARIYVDDWYVFGIETSSPLNVEVERVRGNDKSLEEAVAYLN